MLQKLGDHIAECRRRAAECQALADSGVDEAAANQYLEMARHWTRVADSYEFNVQLERFLQDTYKRGWPFQLDNLPKPPNYDDD
jgi:hypothetical protein